MSRNYERFCTDCFLEELNPLPLEERDALVRDEYATFEQDYHEWIGGAANSKIPCVTGIQLLDEVARQSFFLSREIAEGLSLSRLSLLSVPFIVDVMRRNSNKRDAQKLLKLALGDLRPCWADTHLRVVPPPSKRQPKGVKLPPGYRQNLTWERFLDPELPVLARSLAVGAPYDPTESNARELHRQWSVGCFVTGSFEDATDCYPRPWTRSSGWPFHLLLKVENWTREKKNVHWESSDTQKVALWFLMVPPGKREDVQRMNDRRLFSGGFAIQLYKKGRPTITIDPRDVDFLPVGIPALETVVLLAMLLRQNGLLDDEEVEKLGLVLGSILQRSDELRSALTQDIRKKLSSKGFEKGGPEIWRDKWDQLGEELVKPRRSFPVHEFVNQSQIRSYVSRVALRVLKSPVESLSDRMDDFSSEASLTDDDVGDD